MKNFLLFTFFYAIAFVAVASESNCDFDESELEDCAFFGDKDKDGIEDSVDNCPQTYNPHQDDSDRDGIGDVCDDDDCGCENGYQMIYVCQDNKTRRINCSALNDKITYCGPCESRRMDPCMFCEPGDDGKLTFCHIPLNPKNLRTVKGDCDELERYFNADGSFYYPNDQCGPCNCAMIGDVDTDGDGVCDGKDECPDNPDKSEAGMCGCDDDDSDKDWVCDSEDICPGGNDKKDDDGDGVPNFCDICEGFDDKSDTDGDGIPDGCDSCMMGDADNDGVCDSEDICMGFDDKMDTDGDGIPDGCDPCVIGDADNDGVCDSEDICLGFDDKIDTDGDGIPDGCDSCMMGDADNDGVCDNIDKCMGFDDRIDADGDGTPDGCDVCPVDANNDSDGDGVCDSVDICPGSNDNIDTDGDGVPDGCDSCAVGDADNDGVCDNIDVCPGGDDRIDTDGDGIPDACDSCTAGDVDNDGICDDVDICLQGDDTMDMDLDGVPDACDICPLDFFDDFDNDGVCDFSDKCQGSNDNADADRDGIPDGCDVCPNDASNDSDGDGICDSVDICPNGDDRIDTNNNGVPDACESSYCEVSGQSNHEWIENVKLNETFNESGDDGGYGNFTSIVVDVQKGDSIEVWLTSGYVDDVCELSHYAYIDWNQDGDFADQGEFLFLRKYLRETGANIQVPAYALTGPTRLRVAVTYGRLDGPCDPCFDGEIEDYTIMVKPATGSAAAPDESKTSQTKSNEVEVVPNPVAVGTALRVRVTEPTSAQATITIIDLDGNQVAKQEVTEGTNLVDTQGFLPGIYIVEYKSGDEIIQSKIIIQD